MADKQRGLKRTAGAKLDIYHLPFKAIFPDDREAQNAEIAFGMAVLAGLDDLQGVEFLRKIKANLVLLPVIILELKKIIDRISPVLQESINRGEESIDLRNGEYLHIQPFMDDVSKGLATMEALAEGKLIV